MTPDELAKHGLRVKPLKWATPGDERFRETAEADHIAGVCRFLEPIAPPDVAQAARVLALVNAAKNLKAAIIRLQDTWPHEIGWNEVTSFAATYAEDDECELNEALRAIADGGGK